jgi:hypothetical protein
VCDHGHDPQSQCQNCLPGLTVKTINGYNYCVNGVIQTFNYWLEGNSSQWAVLTTNNNVYINGGHDSQNMIVSFNSKLLTDNIKKIIFEPTGDNCLFGFQLKKFPGDALVKDFGSAIGAIDVTNDLLFSGYNYYLNMDMNYNTGTRCHVAINVYFSS